MSSLFWRLVIAVCFYFLLFHGLGQVGMLSVDEPRYASIGREMAVSGDWITPRLWGEPWFEKPALLYWLVASGHAAGLPAELAARLPVALLGLVFLVVYWRRLAAEFGYRPACYATAMLAASAGWLGFSHVAVTDLPLACCYAAAMLFAMPWALRGERKGLLAAGICLGLAVLAKGLVPLVLALPALWFGRRRLGLLWMPALAALAVAAPWYLLCAAANGGEFLVEFFWRHHFQRVASEALQHVQPFWFYLPVLAAGLFPFTPLLGAIDFGALRRDARLRYLATCCLFGLVFFSLSVNKLPGYLLPLMPLLLALVGAGLDSKRPPAWLLALPAALLALLPVIASILPVALSVGLRKSTTPALPLWHLPLFLLLAGAVWFAARRRRTALAMGMLFVAAAAGTAWLKRETLPVLDRQLSARPLWNRIAARSEEVCLEEVRRGVRYGLQYYAGKRLPDCAERPLPLRVVQVSATEARLVE